MLELDLSTDFGARAARRLKEEQVIWLTTVRNDRTPQPTPVWFLWDGDTFLIYSQEQKQKLRNIAHNPKVALHFNSDPLGEDIIVISGEAGIDKQTPPADQVPAYLEKYRGEIQRIGMTPESFAQSYFVPIRVRPTGIRGH